MLKRLILLCMVTVFSVSAQFHPYNSRMESLAETYIIDDINDVIRYAAYMKNYENDLQVTFTSPIIGIKSIEDKFRIGFIGNRGLMLSQQVTENFYSTAIPFVDSAIQYIPDISISNQWIPHALFGIDVGVFSLGFDLFLEYARSSYSQENPDTIETKASASIHNPGFLASLIYGEKVQIAAKFGLAAPRISGKLESASLETEAESDKGLYLEFGGEAGIPIRSVKLSLGADFILERYAFLFENTIIPQTVTRDTSDEFTNTRTALYAGVSGNVFTDGLWAAQYALNITGHTSKAGNDDWVRTTSIFHIFSVCLEKGWDKLWVLDKVYARGGMRLNLETPLTSNENSEVKTKTKSQTNFSQIIPTVGIGICKGIFTLDLNINLNQWDHLVTGPGVSKVTAGLMF
ncbi:MAG TPA: hypothetical protein VHP36_06075 [Chitinispirillaceae bacterium]|nr:hypothetical protein [Chitinispirillaceae bacterium]